MTAPRETSVRRAVVAYLHTLGPDVCYRSNPASPYNATGEPDLFVCVDGRLLAIELKRPGWKPTPTWKASAQARRLEAWAHAGAVCAIVTSRDQVQQLIETVRMPSISMAEIQAADRLVMNKIREAEETT